MQTYAECLASLFKEQHDKYHWKSSEIIIPVATSMTDSTSRLVNIADTIGYHKRTPPPIARNDQTCYWMSPQFNTNTQHSRKNHLYPLLVKACHEAGFKVVCQYVSNRCAILVGCHRSLFHPEHRKVKQQHSNDEKNARARKTQRPVQSPPKAVKTIDIDSEHCLNVDDQDDFVSFMGKNDESCRFKFSIYWDVPHQRWFFPLEQGGSTHHCGHIRLDSNFLRLKTQHILNEAEQQLARDSL